jgi:tRNA pseudouridine13 synthase
LEKNRDNTHTFKNDEREVEKIVGIEVFSTSGLEGIRGIIKNRYKDFIVKEITYSGHILEINEDYAPTSYSVESKDNYTTFNLVKINKDTFEAVRLISDALGIPPKAIEYSGLKDKRAISVQQASIKGNHVEKLKKLKINDIFIRNINPSKYPVKLGSNWGNHFEITIRNIKPKSNEKKKIEELLAILRKQGFPNYYGLQRFGTFRPNSHLLGRFILEGEFKKAFDELVIATYSSELPQSQRVREDLRKTGDLEKAYNTFPKSLNYERTAIKYLLDNPGDYEGAINHLPKYLIKLLISSFQSYLFNKTISLRHKKGISLTKPIKGDVFNILDDENGNKTQIKYNYNGLYDKFLKEAYELNRAKIVFPLIGYKTNLNEFPSIKSLVLEIMDNEGISSDIFTSKLLETYEFKGSFRPIIIKPLGLKILEYTDDDLFQNRYKLKIEFSLQKGSYATLLLREIIK